MAEDGSERDSGFVQSLQRGLAVIRAFDAENPALTLSDVAKATDLAPATARRFVLTLVDLGYMRAEGRWFRLSPRVLELGRPYLSSMTLPAIAAPQLRELVADVRESSSIAILDGSDIVYVAHEAAKRLMSVRVTVGTRDPAFATSLGRVLIAGQSDEWLEASLATLRLTQITPATIAEPAALLAELRRIRTQGFALVDQEFEEGLRALSAPIHDRDGTVIAALNVAVHASRWSIEAIHDDLLPRLLRATAAIDADLRDAPAPATGRRSMPREQSATARRVTETAERETDFVQSLQRGLAVIRAFDAENPALTLSDVAKVTGLARAAARRFVLTLVELGYMRADGRLFRLSPRVLELGRPYLTTLSLPEIAAPHLRDFVEEVQESSSVATLDGTEILYVAHVSAKRIMSVTVPVGTRDPAFATSLGRALLAGQDDETLAAMLESMRLPKITEVTIVEPKALLAELQQIRRQGYVLVDQELEEGLRALAVPLHGEQGEVIAAVNVAVHASRWSIERILEELLPRLRETAAAIEADVRAVGAPAAEPLARAMSDSLRLPLGPEIARGPAVEVLIEGRPVTAYLGETVATVLLAEGHLADADDGRRLAARRLLRHGRLLRLPRRRRRPAEHAGLHDVRAGRHADRAPGRARGRPGLGLGLLERRLSGLRLGAAVARRRTLLRGQDHLAQAHGVGRHLDALVVADELERLVERELLGRDQAHQLVRGRGAHVGELLLLDRVHVEIVRARVLADDAALVDLVAGRREERAALLQIEERERVGVARAGRPRGCRSGACAGRRATARSARTRGA